MSPLLGTVALAICVCASAQAQTADSPAPLAPPVPVAQSVQPDQITIERVEQGFVFAPDARVTEVNGKTAMLAGGYAGWMTDRTWIVGAGGYWLANQDDDLKMAYGGMVVEYLVRSQERIAFGVGGLAGGGRATLGSTIGEYFGVTDASLLRGDGRHGQASHMFGPGRGDRFPITADTEVLVREYFFVFEPHASVILNFTRWARLDLGVGYRVTAGAGPLDEHLRGPSASVAVQFGGSSRKP
jgi:hypothetical protein